MTKFRFQEWDVYRDARGFRQRMLREVVKKLPSLEKFELASQLRRALYSIVLNLAEGAYRSSDRDFAVFLNRSGASVYEVVAILDLFLDDGYIAPDEHQRWLREADGIVRQLGAFQKHALSSSSS